MDPIQYLLNIRKFLSVELENDAAVRWFNKGIDLYLTASERSSLDNCLGLNSIAGKPTPRTKYLKALRNEHIRQAAREIKESKPTATSEKLAAEIKAYESRIYPHIMHKDSPPEGSAKLRQHLFWAAKTGEPLPTQWRQVYRILYDV